MQPASATPAGFQHKLNEYSITSHPRRSFFPYPGFTDAQRAWTKQKGGGESQTLHSHELVFATKPFHPVIYAEPEHPSIYPDFEAQKITHQAALIAWC